MRRVPAELLLDVTSTLYRGGELGRDSEQCGGGAILFRSDPDLWEMDADLAVREGAPWMSYAPAALAGPAHLHRTW